MDLWTMVVIVVAIGCTETVLVKWLKARAARNAAGNRTEEFEARLRQIEERMGNIETIVLEKERHREFDRAL
jgi:hypothetical protein